ncbi:MAG: ankyrin repeat domain-containing protein, partial [Endozoicomonadaceae bacterium]|nr:ankyrin repeat domain-containing protein [Endozoicomonadaceae bacterium]
MNSSIVDPSRNPAWGYQIKGNEVVYAPLYQAISNTDNFPQSIAAINLLRALLDLILNPDNNLGKISRCFDNAVSASKPTNDKADIKSAIAEELFSAVRQNDSAKLQKLINSTNDINIKNRKGDTLLHMAIKHNAVESVRLLIVSGIDVFVKNKNGKRPFFYAVNQDNIEFMELFRLHFDHLNYAEYNGEILYYAVSRDKQQWIDFLLAFKHINVNYKNEDGCTPVNIAARWYPDCVLKLTSDPRVDPGIPDKYGNNALASAVLNGSLECVSFLMVALSNPEITAKDKLGYSLLHKVLASDNVEMLKLLLEYEILDINAQNEKGYTPLILAVCVNARQCFERLLCQGIDPYIKNYYGNNVLHMAAWHESYSLSKEDNLDNQVWFTSRLLEAGVNLGGHNSHGSNILHLAVKRGNAELIGMLSAASRNHFIALDRQGFTPIGCAIYQADKACLMAMRELP